MIFILAVLFATPVDHSQAQVKRTPSVRQEHHRDRSPPLRSITPKKRQKHKDREPKHVPRGPAGKFAASLEPREHLQTSNPASANPVQGTSFDGIGEGFSGPNGQFQVMAAPPDTNGDVGPNHYVQVVNTDLAVFDKTGRALYGPVPLNTLWSGFGGGCETNNDGDPLVLYDQIADRWIISQFSVSTTPYLECVAVSQSPDPTGAYYRYSFEYGNDFNDYPKMGVWPDAYYTTFNIFTNGDAFGGTEVCAYDRAKMLVGAPATQQCFKTSIQWGGLLPADLDGTKLPPVGDPEYLMAFGTNDLGVWRFHVDWSDPGKSSFTGPTLFAVPSFNDACNDGACIPQAGSSSVLDSLGDRLMYRLAYRNFGSYESIVVTHSVMAEPIVGVRWYEIHIDLQQNLSVYQSGTYAPDSNYRWMGSAAQDQQGNVAMGFSLSGPSITPRIHYTGRLAADPLGLMTQGESSIINPGGSQTGGLNRWGDYSNMSVDPVDDCTFWYTTEYLPVNGSFNWHTRIGSFKFPGCASPIPVPDAGLPDASVVIQDAGQPDAAVIADAGHPDASVPPPTDAGQPPPPPAPNGIINGGFEAGSLTGWTTIGIATLDTRTIHSGVYSLVLGSPASYQGDSSASQTFVATGTSLSFWYKVVCDDNTRYDWATATLKDNTAKSSKIILKRICSFSAPWVQIKATLIKGRSYTLTLTDHDDGYPGDPTYTYFDDVEVR